MKKIILLLLLFITSLYAEKNVLVLHSYHHGLEWTDDISKGLLDTLDDTKEKVNLFFEYLDAKRNTKETFLNETYKYLKLKHKNQKYDLIVVSDNKALQLLNEHYKEFSPNTPVVFCGINNFDKNMVSNIKEVTGVRESVEHKQTINLAENIFPERKYLLVILDDTLTAQKIGEEVEALEKEYRADFKFVYFSQMNDVELKKFLINNSNDIVAYLLTYNIDRNGKFYSYKESIAHFRTLLGNDIPIVGSWSFFLGKGLVGGAITSGYKQGNIAGELAIKILFNKIDASKLPIINSRDAIENIGDYNYMKYFNISKSQFPIGTKFINQPASFVVVHITEFVIAAFFIFMILLIIISGMYLKLEENNILDKMNKALDEKVKLATKQLRENERLFKFIADTSQNIIFLMDLDFKLIYINLEFREFATIDLGEKDNFLKDCIDNEMYTILKQRLEELSSDKKYVNDEYIYKDKNSQKVYKVFYFARLGTDNNIVGYKVVIEDMTQVSQKIDNLKQEINNDSLTGLYNRTHFDEVSKELFNEAQATNSNLSLLMVDIDHFKQVNDNFGHFIGDEVLKKIAILLKRGVRKEDKVYRIGGEEFAIMLKVDSFDAIRIAEQIRTIICEETLHIEKNHFMITASIGVSVFSQTDKNFCSLYRRADLALYEAKKNGRNLVCQA